MEEFIMILEENVKKELTNYFGKQNDDALQCICDYVCNNASAVLANKIVEKKLTIQGAFNHIVAKAKAKASGRSSAMASDKEVFGWAMDYFEEVESDNTSSIPMSQPVQVTKYEPVAPKTKKKVKKEENKNQTSLFDFL